MRKPISFLRTLLLAALLAPGSMLFAGEAPPPLSHAHLTAAIQAIDPAIPNHLGHILNTTSAIDGSTELRTPAENEDLRAGITAKFNEWVRNRADDLDADDPNIKPYFDMQAIQRTGEYDDYTDEASKAYKEQKLADSFNQWMRNRADDLDPTKPDSLKDFFDLQLIQATEKYDELATPDTMTYKHETMGTAFNEWMVNRVNDLDPNDPDLLKALYDLQIIQATEKYDEFATQATHDYKEEQIGQVVNDWVRGLADDLDPNDPDFLRKLEELRLIQSTDKFEMFGTAETTAYKEPIMRAKFSQFITTLVDQLDPSSPSFPKDLADLRLLQISDFYEAFALPEARHYKESNVAEIVAGPPGLHPLVAAIWPEPGALDIPIHRPLVIAFNQPMIPATMIAATEVTPPLPLLVEGMDNGHLWSITPQPNWLPDTLYTVTVSPLAQTDAGLELPGPVAISFRTAPLGPPPAVLATVPLPGDSETPGSTHFEITFDQAMWPPSVEAALSTSPPFPYAPLWLEGDTRLRMIPLAPLVSDTAFSIDIAASAESALGTPMEAPFQLEFFTGIHGPAAVSGTLPVDGEIGLPSAHPIQMVFNRSMDTGSIANALSITPPLDFIPLWYEANMVLQLEPLYSLQPATTYTVTIANTARTTFGLPLPVPYEFRFTTADVLYKKHLEITSTRTGNVFEAHVRPGDLHEYLDHFPAGATLPVLLFHAPDLDSLRQQVDDYLNQLPVTPLRSTTYDGTIHAVRFPDPLGGAGPLQFFHAVLE